MPANASYTYSHDPATDLKDAVRFTLADTNSDGIGWLLSDQEILWLLSEEGSVLGAAARGAEQIAAAFSGPRNISERKIGDLLIRYGQGKTGTQGDWYTVAALLRRRIGLGALPFAGGVDVSDKIFSQDDTSITHPAFRRGQFDPAENGYQPGGAVGSTWWPST